MSRTVEKVKILRVSCDRQWKRINITVYRDASFIHTTFVVSNRTEGLMELDEEEAVLKLCDEIFEYFGLDLRSKVLRAYNRLREKDLGGNSRESIEVPVVPAATEHSCIIL